MSEIMFSHQKRVKKAFFSIWPLPGGLVLPNKSQLSNLQNGHTEMLFLTPHFWPFKNYWTSQKSCFLIRRGLKKPFFPIQPPAGGLVLLNKSQLSTFKMVIQRCFFLTPHFWPFKNHWTCQKSCFLIRRGLKKPFFAIWPLPGGLVLPNKSQLSNLQNGHTEMLFLTPHFWPFKNYWTSQKSCFLIRRGLKKPFFYTTSPRGLYYCSIFTCFLLHFLFF